MHPGTHRHGRARRGRPGWDLDGEVGDTFYEIALRVYDDPDMRQEIAAANGLSTDSTLQVGQVLQLPQAPSA